MTNLCFTDVERAALQTLSRKMSRQIRLPVELETCAEDGPEWAWFGVDCETLVSIQLCTAHDGSRAFVLIGSNGREVGSLGPVASATLLAPLARSTAAAAARNLFH